MASVTLRRAVDTGSTAPYEAFSEKIRLGPVSDEAAFAVCHGTAQLAYFSWLSWSSSAIRYTVSDILEEAVCRVSL